jgi:beta-lactamase regulating signal transducer with metallopeptidase domain
MMQWLINFARWITTGAGLMPLLADAVLKATALLVVAWLASLLFRRSSAAMRHLVWTVALVGSLALPLLLPVVPRWSVPLLPQEVSPATFEAYIPGNAPATLGRAATTRGDDQLSSAPVLPKAAGWSLAVSPTAVLMAIWGTVAIGLLVRLAYAMGRVRPLARRAATGASWLPFAEALAARSGVARRVTFVEGPADTMPMTWGFWRPVVLVPEGAGAWPESRLRTVLLHELAHVARYDCLTQTVAGVVCAIYWFNPLAWMAASRLVNERERACDDAVLAAGADGPDYAEQLLDVARLMRPHGVLAWASVSMARRSQLEGRLLAILDPDLPRRVPTRAAAAVFAAFFVVLVPSLAAIEAGPRASASVDTAVSVPQANSDAISLPATEGTATQAAGQAVTPRPTPLPTPKPMPQPTPKPMPTPTPKVAGPGHDDATRQPVDQKVIDALTAALKDTDAEVQEQAAFALGQIGDARATDALIAAMKDANAGVRKAAAFALSQVIGRQE